MARIAFKWFVFNRTRYQSPRFEVEVRHEGRDNHTIQITDATYNRFVKVANNGMYNVEILPADEGVAWELTRIEYAPKPHDFDGPADPYASPLANPHQCQVEPDGNILFA